MGNGGLEAGEVAHEQMERVEPHTLLVLQPGSIAALEAFPPGRQVTLGLDSVGSGSSCRVMRAWGAGLGHGPR